MLTKLASNVGCVADGTGYVVEALDGKVVLTTHTVSDNKGVLVYGECGSLDTSWPRHPFL